MSGRAVSSQNATRQARGGKSLSRRKLFMKLGQAGHELQQSADDASCWLLVRLSDRGGRRAIGQVAAGLIAELVSSGFLKVSDGKALLTAAGRVGIRRMLVAHGDHNGQHRVLEAGMIEAEDGANQAVMINRAESPLSWLATRKGRDGKPMIAPVYFVAGERLRSDFERGQMSPNVTRDWDRMSLPKATSGGGAAAGLTLTEAGIAARQRVTAALSEVGPELGPVLVDVCCDQRGLEDAERHNGWPKRSGKVILTMALARLARHYGLVGEPQTGRAKSSRIAHWGAEGYRPLFEV